MASAVRKNSTQRAAKKKEDAGNIEEGLASVSGCGGCRARTQQRQPKQCRDQRSEEPQQERERLPRCDPQFTLHNRQETS
jgi:hypothetical protein